jgi:hypothetical protein
MGWAVDLTSRKPLSQTRQLWQMARRTNRPSGVMVLPGWMERDMDGVKVGSEWVVAMRGLIVTSTFFISILRSFV